MTVGRFFRRAISTRAVHRDGRRAGAALGAEEHHRRRPACCRRRRGAARGGPPERLVEGLRGRRPGEELVGPGAHRLDDQVGIDRRRPRRRWRRAASARGAARSPASPPPDSIRMSTMTTSGGVLCAASRRARRTDTAPDAEAPCNCGDKFFVVADDQSVELRHRYPPSAGATIARNAWRAQPDMPLPTLAAVRTPRQSAAAAACSSAA